MSDSTRKMPDARADQRTLPKEIAARELFQGARELWIEHAGFRYRLRITRRNKLVLQK